METATNSGDLDRSIDLLNGVFTALLPPVKLTVSEWSDRYRVLSPENSAYSGQWSTDVVPYWREPMDALSERDVRSVVIMAASQTGKSELILNLIGYHAHLDPSPLLWVLPNSDTAKEYSATRLSPMIRDSKPLTELFGQAGTKAGGNSLSLRKFPGGYVSFGSANVSQSISGKPIRVLLMDEVDRMARDCEGEGSPIAIATRRTATWWNSKRLLVSSPTTENDSPIFAEWESGTEKDWHCPCPGCGCFQKYDWKRVNFKTAKMECEGCKEEFSQYEWQSQNRLGRWIGAREVDENGNRLITESYKLSALPSPFIRWTELISLFLEYKERAKNHDYESLKTFTNTVLAELWKTSASNLSENDLYNNHRVYYGAAVPDEVVFLVAGCDVQDTRIEVTVLGATNTRKYYVIEHVVIEGSTLDEATWTALDEVLSRSYEYRDGARIGIGRVAVDSGGHATSQTYGFVKSRQPRVMAIKGLGGERVQPVRKGGKASDPAVNLVIVGVDGIKSNIHIRLGVKVSDTGSIVFPMAEDGSDAAGITLDYFKQLTSEYQKAVYKNGMRKVVWTLPDGRHNEALDTMTYAFAALEYSRIFHFLDLDSMKRPQKGAVTVMERPKWIRPEDFPAYQRRMAAELDPAAKTEPAAPAPATPRRGGTTQQITMDELLENLRKKIGK
jgi:phage terminase large subunit GpA-like protein